jgi:hypothetical protein
VTDISTLKAAMERQWTVFVQQQGSATCEPVAVGTFKRRIDGATPADFGSRWLKAGHWCRACSGKLLKGRSTPTTPGVVAARIAAGITESRTGGLALS